MIDTSRKRFSRTLDAWLGNLSKTGRSSKQAVAVLADFTSSVFALWAAYSLRLGEMFVEFSATLHLFLFLPIATVIIFMSLGIYRWVIRSSNANLIEQIFKGCICSSLFLVLLTYLAPPNEVLPRSLFIIYGLILMFVSCGIRLLWRSIFSSGSQGEPVAIYGAGEAGRQLLHSLSRGSEYRPVVFLEDNRSLAGTTVGGSPVIHAESKNLVHHLLSLEVERVILALPSVSANDYRDKIVALNKLGFAVQTIPTHAELVNGSASMAQIRNVSIADVLGRSEVPASSHLLGKCVSGRVVLVTGGGGSIGSELCRQIVFLRPLRLVVVDHSEENLYGIMEELKTLENSSELPATDIDPILCSVTDKRRMKSIFERYEINTVYHAAAYKHVPIIEDHPDQGALVNVFGTLTVLDAAIENGVDNFVLISTDKAVRPTNAMGASKRVAELVLQAKGQENITTKISMVRFGNVLGSSGSVLPKFKKQIEAGGPITLTHPNITRYFMTIPEAAQLVLQASSIAKGGDVFLLDMGEPVRIEDLAITLVRLSGKRLKRDTGNAKDIEIVIEGLRPGEKMYEELFITNDHKRTSIPKVFTADEFGLSWSDLSVYLDRLKELADRGEKDELRKLLLFLAFFNDSTPVVHSWKVEKNSKVKGHKSSSNGLVVVN